MFARLNTHKRIWLALFSLWALQGFIALLRLIGLPSERNEGLLFGLSAQRLISAGALCFWIVLCFILINLVLRRPSWLENWLDLNRRPRLWDIIFALALMTTIACQAILAILWGLAGHRETSIYGLYAERLSPLLNLATLVSVEIFGAVVYFRSTVLVELKPRISLLLKKGLLVWGVLAFIAIIIAVTGLGIIPSGTGDWSRGLPAVPLLEWQIILASLVCLAMVIAETRTRLLQISHLDLWISLAIWLGTVTLWLSQPVIPNASALKPHEPNYEIYPFIDAQVYDEYAQSVLIGNGFKGDEIPPRPLYVLFLVFMHTLVGQDYERMIALQSLFLAAFPVLLYFLCKEFFGRPVGIAIALLAALRDYTSNIAAPFAGNLSYSKVYLSEIPVAILLILALLAAIRWIKSDLSAFSGFMVGGILGIAMLIRTQAIVAFPVVVLIAFAIHPKRIWLLMRGAFLMVLGIVLVISPWLWRNWRITGELIFDNPATQTMNLTIRYSRLMGKEADIIRAPGESSSDYNDRLIKGAMEAISADPAEAAKGVVNHFLNHGVDNILLFPLRNDLLDPGELWQPSRAFWEMWEGRPTLSQGLLLACYVFLFGLGLAAAWHRLGWLGFLPLGLNLAYNMWTSLSLLSGQRFLLAMDWSVYLYYMIGIFSLLSGFLLILESGRSMILEWYKGNPAVSPRLISTETWRHYVLAGILLFFLGASLPLGEVVFPKRYPLASQGEILARFIASPAFKRSGLDSGCIQKVVSENQLIAARGMAFFPRYYESGDGEGFTAKYGYKVSDEARMVFYMAGSENGLSVLPLSEMPAFFPNASDVTVIRADKAWFTIVKQGETERLYVSDLFDPSVCR